VGAAIYLQEYARKNFDQHHPDQYQQPGRCAQSIVYGMLGLAIFVRALEALTSGAPSA
jgi:phosphate transport system permease protein